MIKTKEATESAALEFCPHFEQIRSPIGRMSERQRLLGSVTFNASFRRKLGGSAICSKCEQNSTAALSVASLVFIIYSKSTVGQLQI